jgi:hypothetical protein
MKELEEKIQEIKEKESKYAYDYIDYALESYNPTDALIKLVLKYSEMIAEEKIKLETIQFVVSEQYFK